ncbi:transglycosylase SLT domain-containing protein [Vibrio sp. PP-XX7]
MVIQKRFIYLLVVLLCSSPSAFAWHNKYDWQIKKAARHYLPTISWQLYKAQLIQESALNADAVSPVGAAGLAQFMPETWDSISREMGITGSRLEPELAVPAGAYYMAKLRRVWKWPRPEEDRHNLALACYNAGCGNILKAQRLCGNPSRYTPIMACLPQVTGQHAVETLNYAPGIRRIYQRLMYE